MENKLFLKRTFYSLIMVFVLLIVCSFISSYFSIEKFIFPVIAILGIIFLVLGIVLAIIARKEIGKLKLFLMTAGISAVCPLVFSILHNVFYAMAVAFEKLGYLFEILHAVSFIIAIIVAPILFIIGIIGGMVYLRKELKEKIHE